MFDVLNWSLETHPDMALATCGAPDAEKLALHSAQQMRVRAVIARQNFHPHKGAAPFKANDQILDFEPILVPTLANAINLDSDCKPSGVALNLGQKAEQAGIRPIPIRARA